MFAFMDAEAFAAPADGPVAYQRSMTESMTLTTMHGTGSIGQHSPAIFHRYISESVSLTGGLGKAPNSYSRSMTEQATITTGMPPAAGPQLRAAPAPVMSYSASSNQRIDERFSLRNLASVKADPAYKSTAAGTPTFSSELAASGSPELSGGSADIVVFDTASSEGDSESGDHSNSFLRQIAAFEDYASSHESMRNAATLNASVSAVFLAGTMAVVVARQPAVSGGRMQKRIFAIFLLKHGIVEDRVPRALGAPAAKPLLLIAAVFTVPLVAVSVSPSFAQENEAPDKAVLEIVAAHHLDSDRAFLGDITAQSGKLDNVWSNEIEDGHYVRATFEQELSSKRDISVFARTVSGEPRIEIYEKDGIEPIAEIRPSDGEYSKALLKNLQGLQDSFDLRVVGGSLELDHIVDPWPVPTYVGAGTFAESGDNVNLTPALPLGVQADDILLLFVETRDLAVTVSDGNGGIWTEVADSPQGIQPGTAATATRLTVFWSRHDGSQGDPTIDGANNHNLAVILAFRGVVTTGDPWDVTSGNTEGNDNSLSATGDTTTIDNTLVVIAAALAEDGADFATWTNGDLANLTEQVNISTTLGNDGRLGVVTGEKAAAGAYAATTNTLTDLSEKAMMTIALRPPPPEPPALSISQPDGAGDTVTRGDPYNITYTLTDPDDVTTAAFFYDTDSSGFDGTAISGACATAAEGTDATCQWDTTNITPGSYFIYGIADDGTNPAVSAYSSGQITINGLSNLRNLSEQMAAADAVAILAVYGSALTEQLVVADSIQTESPNAASRSIMEQAGMSESISPAQVLSRSMAEQMTLTDSTVSARSVTVPVADQAAVSDDVEYDHAVSPPTYVGAGTFAAGGGVNITPTLPVGLQTGDILLLFVESPIETVIVSDGAGGTWTEVADSPQSADGGTLATSTRLTVFWSRYNGSQLDPTLENTSGSLNHHFAVILAFRGVVTTGDPWDVTSGGVETTADTSGSIPGDTSTVDNTLIVIALATNVPNADGTDNFDFWTNNDLTDVTERFDLTSTAGNGGGIGIATGEKTAAGSYGQTDVTVASATKAGMTIALKPLPVAPNISISQPDGAGDSVNRGDPYNITYTLSDPDDVTTAAFFYDTDSSGLDGTAISGACATAAEGTDATCQWDTTGIPTGSYYIYGIADDGTNPQVSDYSPGQVTINPGTFQRNASEQLGAADTIAGLAAYPRSLAEQAAFTDAVSITTSKALFEQMATTDALVRSFDGARTASDALVVSDAIAREPTVQRTMAEQMTVGDTLARISDPSRSVTETLAVQDTISMAVSTTITEQLVLTDQIGASAARSGSMSEQLGLADTMELSVSKPLSDSLAVIDVIARAITQSRTMTEQLVLQDTVSTANARAISEQLAVADAISRTFDSSRAATEQMTLADTVSVTHSRSLLEQLGIADTLQRSMNPERPVAEQLAVADTVAIDLAKSTSESLVLNDTVARTVMQTVLISEQMTMTEAAGELTGKPLQEQMAVTESAGRLATLFRSMSEQITLEDTMSAVSAKAMSDQLAASDTIQRYATISRAVAEQLAMTEAASKSSSRVMSEQLAVTDDIQRSMDPARNLTEQLTTGDAIEVDIAKQMSESLTLGDSVTRTITQVALISEQMAVTEAVDTSVDKSLQEQLVMTESVGRLATLSRSVSEQMTVGDAGVAVAAKVMVEQLAASDSIQRIASISRAVSEQMAMSETASKATSRIMAEQLAITDDLQRSMNPARNLTEQMAITDTMAKAVEMPLSESLGVGDSAARIVTQTGSASEQIGLAESIAITVSGQLSEQLGVTDAAVRSVVAVRAISEQLAVADTVQAVGSKTVAEQLAMNESIQVVIGAARTTSEQLGVSETVSSDVSKAVAEQLGIGDAVAAAAAQARSSSEQLAAADTVDRAATLSRSLTEQLAITETAGLATAVSISEQLVMTDSAATSIARSISEQLAVSDSVVATSSGDVSASDQFAATESIAISVAKEMTDGLVLSDTVMVSGSTGMSESAVVVDAVARAAVIARAVSESLSVADSATGAPVTFVSIADSMGLGDAFSDISAAFGLDLPESLVLGQGFATEHEGLFDHAGSEGIVIGDGVVLVLGSVASASETMSLQDQISAEQTPGRGASESLQSSDSLSILVVRTPPPPPAAIATMPELVMTQKNDVSVNNASAPAQAVAVSGTWDIENLDDDGLETLLVTMGMPVYDVSDATSSGDIGDMTMVLPTFQLSMAGEWEDDGAFLTPTLSDLPAGMQVMVPVNVEASMGGSSNLALLGNMTVSFTPAAGAENFAMLIAVLDQNPEGGEESPGGMSAFYIDVSIAGDFGALEPSDEAFFGEPPEVTFTVTEEWANEQDTERDENGVPVISLYLLDEGTGEWEEIADIDPPTAAVGDVYTYTATLPHFSTYVVAADSASSESGGSGGGSGGGGGGPTIVRRFMVESLAVQSIMQPTGFGEEIARDLADLLAVGDSQDQERQRILTIQNVTVAVNVADIRSAGFGAAVAILNFEITNKNGLIEELVLRYSYSDPATGQNVYQGEQSVTVGAGESVIQTVRVPFSSTGIYEVMVEVKSGDGTIASTDVVVEVPWLEVYLYVLTLIVVTVVGAPVAYLVYSLRQGHAPAIMRSSGAEGNVAQLIRRVVAASKFVIQTLQRSFGFGGDMPVGAVRYPAVRATRRLKIALYAMAGAAMTAAGAIGVGLDRAQGIAFKGLNGERPRRVVRHSARRIRQLAAMLAPAGRTATAAAKEHAKYAARALVRVVRFVARQAGYGGST